MIMSSVENDQLDSAMSTLVVKAQECSLLLVSSQTTGISDTLGSCSTYFYVIRCLLPNICSRPIMFFFKYIVV